MEETSEVLITTSRRPSRLIRTFCKDLYHVFPNVIHMNRGKLSLDRVAERALEFDADRVLLVSRWKGGTGKIQFYRIDKVGLKVLPPLIYVNSVKLSRDFNKNKSKKRRINSIVITTPQNTSLEVERLSDSISNFFDIPILPLKEIYKGKFDATVHFSSDTPHLAVMAFKLIPGFVEIGPQIIISNLLWVFR